MPQINEQFGLLTVVKTNKGFCECLCRCGNTLTVKFWKLTGVGGHRVLESCGCLKGTKTEQDTYKIWAGMKRRCTQPNSDAYKNYGGRGIKVCERWFNSFPAFLMDMGSRPSTKHSIDRIDNNGDYTPTNCRWATQKEQSNNKRTNRMIEIDGKTQTLTQWCEEYQIKYSTVENRLRRCNWAIKEALITPVKKS